MSTKYPAEANQENAQPSAPDDRPLPRQRVHQLIDRLHAKQSFHRDAGFVWRNFLAWYCSNDAYDFVDQIFLVKVAAWKGNGWQRSKQFH